MPTNHGRPPPAPAEGIELRRGQATPAPAQRPVGKGSRTRFLSVKKFRFARARTMLFIGVAVVGFIFLAWCGLYLMG
jgi:hypothetical protein